MAGIVGSDVPVDELERLDWDQVIGVNLTGPYLVVKHAVPHLERTGRVVVFTGPGAGIFNAQRSVAYAATKGGLRGLSIALEEHLRRRGIESTTSRRVPSTHPLVRRRSSDALVDERKAAGNVIDASQVAALMVFLASSDAVRTR